MIASKPLDGGKLIMKSMETLSHSLLGIGNGHNNPVYFLLKVRFCGKSSKSSCIPLHRLSN
jgi:hypothetical protein